MWQQNLISNLIALLVILALFIIVYCKMKDVTLMELIKELRGIE